MFGTFTGLVNLPPQTRVDPEDIPPPTPICLPRYQPFAQEDAPVNPKETLPNLLKHTGRSTASLGPLGLSAIGFDLKLDVEVKELIPDPSYIPDFEKWGRLTPDEASDKNQTERSLLRNEKPSPGSLIYLERLRELSNANEDAFRTVRRIPPPKGKQQARLGNAYEFFRCLELFTTYWDDPTQPPPLPPSPEILPSEMAAPSEGSKCEGGSSTSKEPPKQVVARTADGSAMPAEFRQNLISAFVKLISYDFGCNVSMARVEPRLHMSSSEGHPRQRKSYNPSNCHFLFQSPMTREAARAGLIYGPLAAVSARPGVSFSLPDVETAQSLDLAREVVAALITAQHRAREGKTEKRFGEGQWWTSKPRWGGGPGGPIGREIDKDAAPSEDDRLPRPPSKRPRKTMSIYDNYRMVRPPAYSWDKKANYEAIGKKKGTNFDDIFVISSIFHHISILRVRVPTRLLEVLDGSPEPDVSRRSWGKVQGWRSQWYDMFDIDQRLAAMRLVWAMMAYQMRTETEGEDAAMTDG